MKTRIQTLIAGASAIAALAAAHAQNYSIDWSTIGGGGGVSTGGVYRVEGTIGQPHAATISGGNYTLTGGFWSLVSVVQTPGAPTLSIYATLANTVLVVWPSPSTGYLLQQNNDLNTTKLGYGTADTCRRRHEQSGRRQPADWLSVLSLVQAVVESALY
jgi:hypothetical protein